MDAQTLLSLCPRQSHEYWYVLLDPLQTIPEDSPLHCTQLSDAVAVARADLAHTPAVCPQLVMLGKLNQDVNLDLLSSSLDYALDEIARDKRTICGWITSEEGPLAVAHSLAGHCVVRDAPDAACRLIPLFEPRRLELLRLSAPSAWLDGWLGPIRNWLYLDAAGNAQALNRRTPQPWNELLPGNVAQVQRHASAFAGLLTAWQTCLNTPLPPDASQRALTQLSEAASKGLNTLEAQLAFCLNRIYPQGLS